MWGYTITTIVKFHNGQEEVHVHEGPNTDSPFARTGALSTSVSYMTSFGLVECGKQFVNDGAEPFAIFDVVISFERPPVASDAIDSTNDDRLGEYIIHAPEATQFA